MSVLDDFKDDIGITCEYFMFEPQTEKTRNAFLRALSIDFVGYNKYDNVSWSDQGYKIANKLGIMLKYSDIGVYVRMRRNI